jgi:hypothetical protein
MHSWVYTEAGVSCMCCRLPVHGMLLLRQPGGMRSWHLGLGEEEERRRRGEREDDLLLVDLRSQGAASKRHLVMYLAG